MDKPKNITGGVSYGKLWKLLSDRYIGREQFRRGTGLSEYEMAALEQNKQIGISALIAVCAYLDCGLSDIAEAVPAGAAAPRRTAYDNSRGRTYASGGKYPDAAPAHVNRKPAAPSGKKAILRERFGFSDFREGQEQIIDCLLSGRDALCVMPTGAGKSICYQIPALMLPGMTLVISPLISLMRDQVTALVQNGIEAAYVNSFLTSSQYAEVLSNMRKGKYKIIYAAPERLASPGFVEVCRSASISLVAADEAHCISQWGQDFRPSYLKITDFIEMLPRRPVIGAFTATATAAVKNDIECVLKMRDPLKITTGFDRPNLFFSVINQGQKPSRLLSLIKERRGKSGIVYCSTRKDVEEICRLLNIKGFSAGRYHAGLTAEERERNQEDFIYDRRQIMVATNAFGMGIDKSNVSFVIHYSMPKDLESYYQEAGRAGRDGEPADCILLYSPKDVYVNKFLIEHSEDNPDLTEDEQKLVRQRDLERLKQMTYYSTTKDCLRGFILRYFGEKAPNYCGSCSNCLTQFETVSITAEALEILSCVIRTGNRYGKVMICQILRGGKNERLLRLGLDSQPAYGIMSGYPVGKLREIIDFLEFNGYLESTGGEYPVIRATSRSDDVLRGGFELYMKTAKSEGAAARRSAGKKSYARGYENINTKLLNELKAVRKAIAKERAVPPYIIFSDKTLIDMCLKQPTTYRELLTVTGVGVSKADWYGSRFLDVIRRFR